MTRFGDAPVVHKDAPLQGKRKPGVCRDPDKRRAYKTAWQAKARASTKSGEAGRAQERARRCPPPEVQSRNPSFRWTGRLMAKSASPTSFAGSAIRFRRPGCAGSGSAMILRR